MHFCSFCCVSVLALFQTSSSRSKDLFFSSFQLLEAVQGVQNTVAQDAAQRNKSASSSSSSGGTGGGPPPLPPYPNLDGLSLEGKKMIPPPKGNSKNGQLEATHKMG